MKKELASVFFANLFFLIINLAINFLIPKYVSVETYSLIKTYTLYISYAGLFHLGYNDGMYLKYGGKKIENINKKDLSNNFFNYFLLNLFMFTFILIIALVLHNNLFIAFAFGMISCNIMNYLKSLYQATGKFKLYGIALNTDRVSVFTLSIIALFLLKSDNYLIYIWIQILTSIICAIILITNLENNLKFLKYGRFKITEYIDNIKSGIILLLGNFSNSFFTTMDRWFIKFLLTSYDFATYSLAASLENIISVVVSPITITMYNYFCKNQKKEFIIKIKNLTLLYGFIIITGAYPIRFILENYLTKYKNACNIIFLLFGAQLFYIIIKGIYVNLYKARKKQKLYFIQLICMIFIGFILNIVLFTLFKNNFAIAFATYITAIIWFISCELLDKNIAYTYKEYVSIIILESTYILTGLYLNSIIGLFVYLIVFVVISILFMKKSVLFFIKIIKNKTISFKNKLIKQ